MIVAVDIRPTNEVGAGAPGMRPGEGCEDDLGTGGPSFEELIEAKERYRNRAKVKKSKL